MGMESMIYTQTRKANIRELMQSGSLHLQVKSICATTH